MDFIYLHEIEQWNLLTIAWSGVERVSRWRDGGDNATNVQYKPIWNYHNEFPLYNEYILIKTIFKKPSN
jgi:hypothetical protein